MRLPFQIKLTEKVKQVSMVGCTAGRKTIITLVSFLHVISFPLCIFPFMRLTLRRSSQIDKHHRVPFIQVLCSESGMHVSRFFWGQWLLEYQKALRMKQPAAIIAKCQILLQSCSSNLARERLTSAQSTCLCWPDNIIKKAEHCGNVCAYVCAGLQTCSTIASLTLPVHEVLNLTQVKFMYNNTEDIPGCFPCSISVLTLTSETWPENQFSPK